MGRKPKSERVEKANREIISALLKKGAEQYGSLTAFGYAVGTGNCYFSQLSKDKSRPSRSISLIMMLSMLEALDMTIVFRPAKGGQE